MLEELELLQIIMVLLTFVILNKELEVKFMVIGLDGQLIFLLVLLILLLLEVVLLLLVVLFVVDNILGMELDRIFLKLKMVVLH